MAELKTAVVTGGSRGIGKAIAIALASEGYRVAVSARGLQNSAATVATLPVKGTADLMGLQANKTDLLTIRS